MLICSPLYIYSPLSLSLSLLLLLFRKFFFPFSGFVRRFILSFHFIEGVCCSARRRVSAISFYITTTDVGCSCPLNTIHEPTDWLVDFHRATFASFLSLLPKKTHNTYFSMSVTVEPATRRRWMNELIVCAGRNQSTQPTSRFFKE